MSAPFRPAAKPLSHANDVWRFQHQSCGFRLARRQPYAGMPDIADYMQGIEHKQQVYRANSLPAVFLYPADLRGPNWPEKVVDQILHAVEPQRRTPPSAYGGVLPPD